MRKTIATILAVTALAWAASPAHAAATPKGWFATILGIIFVDDPMPIKK